jgi:phage-related baseplate assembly protein
MQHAHPNEMVFVLLSRDAAAPVAIRAWVAERLRLGKNVVEALVCAQTMEVEGRQWVRSS